MLEFLLLSAPFAKNCGVATRLESSALLLRQVLVLEELVNERDAESGIHLTGDLHIFDLFFIVVSIIDVLEISKIFKLNQLTFSALSGLLITWCALRRCRHPFLVQEDRIELVLWRGCLHIGF